MAAVLCEGVRLGCKGFCDGLGIIVTAPCRLCAVCCDGYRSCCNHSCQVISKGCNNSLCLYLTVALGLNIPPIVVGVMDAPNNNFGSCPASLWLLIFWILCAIHIMAALYMSVMVQRTKSIFEGGESGPTRVKHLLCYDPVMALYILVLIGFFGWLVLGSVWLADGTILMMDDEGEDDNDDNDNECDDGIGQKVALAFGCGWAFLLVGGCALSMSMCCAACQRPTGK